MELPKYLPEVWSQPLLEALKRPTIYSLPFASEEQPDNPLSVAVRTDKTREWLKARKRFIKRWKKLNQAGVELGYLEQDACYECGGEIIPTTNTADVEYLPNPHFDQARHDAWQASQPDTVTIQSVGRPGTIIVNAAPNTPYAYDR